MTTAQAKRDLALRRRNLRETKALIDANPGTDLFDGQYRDLIAEIARLKAIVEAAKPRVVFGIDPAMIASGHARRDEAGDIQHGTVIGAENIAATVGGIKATVGPDARVYLAVEYPVWKGKGTDAVRAAGNCWIRAMKKAFPRRLSVRKVTPATWMGAMIPGYRKAEHPSCLYVPLAGTLTSSVVPIEENAAAAVCILAWAELAIASGEFIAAKKPKAGA